MSWTRHTAATSPGDCSWRWSVLATCRSGSMQMPMHAPALHHCIRSDVTLHAGHTCTGSAAYSRTPKNGMPLPQTGWLAPQMQHTQQEQTCRTSPR